VSKGERRRLACGPADGDHHGPEHGQVPCFRVVCGSMCQAPLSKVVHASPNNGEAWHPAKARTNVTAGTSR